LKNAETVKTLSEKLFRENYSKMLAVLTRQYGLKFLDSLMDVIQDTFASALKIWPDKGIPENPAAWLMQVAKNRAINAIKRESKTALYSPSVFIKNFENFSDTETDAIFFKADIEDSQLRLLLCCCHPEISEKNQIILTLSIFSGFGLTEISSALNMSEAAVKKALFRAKLSLKSMNLLLDTPNLLKYEKRVETVQTILYLMFNEGYKSSSSSYLIKQDLCLEAVRLCKLLTGKSVVLNTQTHALLALMLFNLARFSARTSPINSLITLAEQDRSIWDQNLITEAFYNLKESTNSSLISRFHIEAIIASIHSSASSFAATDWFNIVSLYKQLEILEPDSAMIKLNRIVASSYLNNRAEILIELEDLKKINYFKNNYLVFASEADILRRMSKFSEALNAYKQAYELAPTKEEKIFLNAQINLITSH
jgi:RNA polymerase sigma factor (sigma-70 family)